MLSTTTIWNVFERENVSSNLLPGELETKDNYLCEAGGGLFATLPPVSYATEEEIRSQIVQKDMSLLGATQQKPDETLLSVINIWIINYIEQHWNF